MKKICTALKKPWIFSLLLNAGVLFVSVFLFRPFFEENDDAFLSLFAEGAYGTREVHLIYSNVILGGIYKLLYGICQSIRWHSVLQYLFMFIAFTYLTYILQKYKNGKVASALLLLASFYEAYVSLQYSKSAAFVSLIGYILIFEYIRTVNTRRRPDYIIVGIILTSYGMLLRDSSFMLATLFFIIFGIFEVVRSVIISGDYGFKSFMSKVMMYAKYIVPVLVIFLGTYFINASAYSKSSEWKRFMEYNDTRMELLDYRYDLLDYVKYGDRLKEMSISENDAMIYLTWQFGDDSVLSVDAMNEILSYAEPRFVDAEFIKAFVKNIYDDVLKPSAITVSIVLCLAVTVLLLLERRKDCSDEKMRALTGIALITAVISLVLTFILLFYYQYSGRWSHRIVYALFLLIVPSYTFCFLDILEEEINRHPFALRSVAVISFVLVIICNITSLLGNRFDYNSYKRSEINCRAFLETIDEHEDILYIADTFTFQKAYEYDVFKPYEEGSLDNFAAVGSWFVNSPVTKKITSDFGYANPFEAMAAGDDKVILLDNYYPEQKLEYLEKHYNKDYVLENIADSYGIKQYRIGIE